MDKPKILFVTDSPNSYSGMGKTCREVANRFHRDGYHVECVGYNHHQTDIKLPYITHPISSRSDRDSLISNILRIAPDILFCHGDLWHFAILPSIKNEYNLSRDHRANRMKVLGYINVDSSPLSLAYCEIIDTFDQIITTSYWGARVLKDYPSKVNADGGNIKTIYHGVDLDLFDKAVAEQKKSNKFMVLVVSKNCVRKQIPLSLEAFHRFSQKKDDTVLYLVTAARDPEGYDLLDIIPNYPGLRLKINLVDAVGTNKILTDEVLAKIYAQSHVLLLNSSCEGLGLPYLEAMASKIVAIGTDYTSGTEILSDGRGCLIEVAAWITGDQGQKMAIPSEQKIVNILNDLYDDWKYKEGKKAKRITDTAYEWVQKYSWESSYEKLQTEVNNLAKVKLEPVKPYFFAPINVPLRTMALEAKKILKGKKYIGVIKLGGYGDTLQLIPVLKGIRRKYPKAWVVAIVERGDEILLTQPGLVDYVTLEKGVHYNTVLKSLLHAFDVLYDVRYLSRVYGEENNEFANKYIEFYNGWAFSNSRIRQLGFHVIDLMLKSCGLENYANINDLVFEIDYKSTKLPNGVDILPQKFLVVHNNVGTVGNLKCMKNEELSEILRIAKGVYPIAQLGTKEDELIKEVDLDFRGLSIMDTANVLKRANLYLGLEGFLYHLAHAVGTPSMVWQTCTPPELFFYKDSNDILINTGKCDPCFWNSVVGEGWWETCLLHEERCLNLPSVEEIQKELLRFIEKDIVTSLPKVD